MNTQIFEEEYAKSKKKKPEDLRGLIFGQLTVIDFAGKHGSTYPIYHWFCRCSCGKVKSVASSHLKSGDVKSCGCSKIKHLNKGTPIVHGGTGTNEYNKWRAVRQRCMNPKNKRFHRYGGRGIKICSRWDSYDNFIADMGPCPKGMTLDRIDNDGDYEPDNCRWADNETQANNRGTTRLIEFNGRVMSVAQWAKAIGITPQSLSYRLKTRTIERALCS